MPGPDLHRQRVVVVVVVVWLNSLEVEQCSRHQATSGRIGSLRNLSSPKLQNHHALVCMQACGTVRYLSFEWCHFKVETEERNYCLSVENFLIEKRFETTGRLAIVCALWNQWSHSDASKVWWKKKALMLRYILLFYFLIGFIVLNQ